MRTGNLPISKATAEALRIIVAIQDGVDETEAQARPVTVALLSLHDLPANVLDHGSAPQVRPRRP